MNLQPDTARLIDEFYRVFGIIQHIYEQQRWVADVIRADKIVKWGFGAAPAVNQRDVCFQTQSYSKRQRINRATSLQL